MILHFNFYFQSYYKCDLKYKHDALSIYFYLVVLCCIDISFVIFAKYNSLLSPANVLSYRKQIKSFIPKLSAEIFLLILLFRF